MKKASAILMGILMVFVTSTCRTQVENTQRTETFLQKKQPKIVLFTIDGVRWQEVFNGIDPELYSKHPLGPRELLPNLYHYFVDNGSSFGRDSLVVVSGTAHISLPGYLEMMRGFPTLDCFTNACEPQLRMTLLDHYDRVALFSSWDIVRKSASNKPEDFVISSGRNYRTKGFYDLKLPDDKDFDCYVGHLDYRPDEFTIKSTFDYLSREKPQFLWTSLGDTDEYAHAGDYDGYINSLKRFDSFIGNVIKEYDENTVFIVTTDHGRSQDWRHHSFDDESSRVWLMIHGSNVPRSGHVRLKGKKSLSDIMPTVLKITHGIKTRDSFI